MKSRLIILFLLLNLTVRVNGAINIVGGNDTLLTLVITEPIIFTATEELTLGNSIALELNHVYTGFRGIFFAEKTGDITATGSQGATFSPNLGLKMGTAGGGINTWANDSFMFGFNYQSGSQVLQAGDTITINPGNAVSTIAFGPRAPDVSGTIEVTLTDNLANRFAFSPEEVTLVPELSSYSLIFGFFSLGWFAIHRRPRM